MKLKIALNWVKRRLTEKSTYAGIATIAAALGAESLGVQIGQVGEIVGVLTGTGLIVAPTSGQSPDA